MNPDTRAGFKRLFAGSERAVGTEAGGCLRLGADRSWDEALDRHLDGTAPAGVYPMVRYPDDEWACWCVKWGCVDIDVEDEAQATNLSTALTILGLYGWIERSRSKGYHVWVFAKEWVPALVMRNALRVACKLSDVDPREVNPKQVDLAEEQLGNYVRLPYVGGQPQVGARRAMRYGGFIVSLDSFVENAQALASTPEQLEHVAAMWVDPPRRRPIMLGGDETPDMDRSIRERMSGLTWTILNQGPLEGSDRSSTLYKLARSCAEDGLTAAEALAVVTEGDLVWGKYHKRNDAQKRLTQLVERAYEWETE